MNYDDDRPTYVILFSRGSYSHGLSGVRRSSVPAIHPVVSNDVHSFVNGKISAVEISGQLLSTCIVTYSFQELITITDITLRNLPTIGINPFDDRFSVHIMVGGQLQRTSTAVWLTSSWHKKYHL